jgi:alpha-tubulin suppressor-like RCC1 family protein
MKKAFGKQGWWLLGLLVLGNVSSSCGGDSFQTGTAGNGGQSGSAQAGGSGTAGTSETGGMSGMSGAGAMSGGGDMNGMAGGLSGAAGSAPCKPGFVVGCTNSTEQAICQSDGTTAPKPCEGTTPYCTGKGICVECINVDDCKQNVTSCFEKTCEGLICGQKPLPKGQSCGGDKVCNGSGVCGDCEPGQTRCTSNNVEVCGDSGTWSVKEACTDKICGASECSLPWNIVADGDHTLLRLKNGAVFGWGSNSHGQLLGNSVKIKNVPEELVELGKVEAISVGERHSCVLKEGKVLCWGDNGTYKQAGSQVTGNIYSPQEVVGITNATKLDSDGLSTCVINTNQELYCWGLLTYDPLQPEMLNIKKILQDNVKALEISVGTVHACGLFQSQNTGENIDIRCWGSGSLGQLGDGIDIPGHQATVPQKTTIFGKLDSLQRIFSRRHTSCVQYYDSGFIMQSYCWGSAEFLGQKTNLLQPFKLPQGVFDFGIAIGYHHSCIVEDLIADTTVVGVECIGDNTNGQLGNGSYLSSPQWTSAFAFPSYPTIATVGYVHSCAIRDNEVYCWGANDKGQVGAKFPDNQNKPVKVL